MAAGEQANAQLIDLVAVIRKRRKAASDGRPHDFSTRGQVAAMLVTVFLIGLGWVSAQGLADATRCPTPNHFGCVR